MHASYFVEAPDLFRAVESTAPPLILDVRPPDRRRESGRLVPGSQLADIAEGALLARRFDPQANIVVVCLHGHNRSQSVAGHLRAAGRRAQVLAGGFEAWIGADLPTIPHAVLGRPLGTAPTRWVTRRRPKIDRVACPWLIRRYIDPHAQFLFVEPDQVAAVAASEDAIAFDVPGAPFEHDGERCTFDLMLEAFGLDRDPALAALADIVRAADTGRLDSSLEAAGLLAISLGASFRHGDDDHTFLREGAFLYDSLLAWLRHARHETHTWAGAIKASEERP